jgi:hypothetical protein
MITYEGDHNHPAPTPQYVNRSSIRRLSNTGNTGLLSCDDVFEALGNVRLTCRFAVGNVVLRQQNTPAGTADTDEIDASLKLALQALPSVSLPQSVMQLQPADKAPSWSAPMAPQPSAAMQLTLPETTKLTLKVSSSEDVTCMPHSLTFRTSTAQQEPAAPEDARRLGK